MGSKKVSSSLQTGVFEARLLDSFLFRKEDCSRAQAVIECWEHFLRLGLGAIKSTEISSRGQIPEISSIVSSMGRILVFGWGG